ncbi:hypothetical protein [Klebsiella aerogenes]|uniref:hypothetical protein n=1 Tax=Klebsiella aerogenes TaxID=548 RepID=UPI002277CB79|nr:hypothetical protein [Klebsiella aerogenes]MCY4762692.1 hypothetical protein [Klebsiella aerogenes]HBT3063123.1 hypothetical protein [Klebsiella aerogenes]
MKFMIFENASNFRVSINKQSGEFQDSMNDKNEITKILKTVSISTDDVKRIRKNAEEIMTHYKMIKIRACMIMLNGRPAYVAFSNDENHAIVVCFDKKWKKFHANISSVYYPNAERALSGNMIEFTDKVNFTQDAKITNVYEELEERIKELEEKLKKSEEKNAELEKENSAFRKNIKGEKLSFEEEVIIAMTEIKSEAATSENNEVFTISNESTLFSVNDTEENLNEPLIVSNDQSTEQNTMTDKQFNEILKEENRILLRKYNELEHKFHLMHELLTKMIIEKNLKEISSTPKTTK